MRRFHFLAILSVALLFAAACRRSFGQENAGDPAPTRTGFPRATVAGPSRAPLFANGAAGQTLERQTLERQPLEAAPAPLQNATLAPRHQSWKGLPRGKSDGKSATPIATLSPWSAAGALAVVVGLILVLARLFRRHAPLFQQSLPQEALEILGRRFVDSKQQILMVRIGARILVIGSSASGLNPLGQIDDPVEVDLLAGMCRRGPQAGSLGTSFFKLLKGQAATRPDRSPAYSPSVHSPSVHSPSVHSSAVHSPPEYLPAARSASANSSFHARQARERSAVDDFTADRQPSEPPPEGLSQLEYDLMRRLRKGPASVPVPRTEGAA